MRIQKRLIVSYITVALLITIGSITACVGLIVLSKQYSNALVDYGFAQGDIGRMMTAFADMRSNTRAIIGYDEQELIDACTADYQERKQEFEEEMALVEAGIVSDEVRTIYNKMVTAVDKYIEVEAEIQKIGSTTDREQCKIAQDLAYEELGPIYREAYGYMEQMMDGKETNGDKISGQLDTLEVVLVIAVIAVIIISILIAIKLGTMIAKGIAQPLNALADRLEKFAKGDLKSPFPHTETEDEVAEMTQSATSMANTLSVIITDIGEALEGFAHGDWTRKSKNAHMYEGDFEEILIAIRDLKAQINSTLQDINDVSGQVSIGASGLAEAAQSLAEGATDQAGSVEELQATIANITNAVNHTAEQTKASYESAQTYSEEADMSRTEMERLMEVMGRISETSEKIGNIISEIEDIASQTNLLSLNASIEAARAGEAGKGFAVVADQIGKLADQSAKSAVDTRTLIESALQEIKEGNSTVVHAADSIRHVVDGVKSIAETSQELSQLCADQATSMNEAELGVNQISEIVQANSAAAEELSATSEEMLAQAENMNNLIGQFKLEQR